jgi:hypothetical protein
MKTFMPSVLILSGMAWWIPPLLMNFLKASMGFFPALMPWWTTARPPSSPSNNYFWEINLIRELEARGDTVFFHSVIMGGESLTHTLTGLSALALGFPETPIVVWLNPHDGPVRLGNLHFEEFRIYQECNAHFHSVLQLPVANKDTLGRDLRELFGRHQTFQNALASPDLRIATRLRLKQYWDEIVSLVEKSQIAG